VRKVFFCGEKGFCKREGKSSGVFVTRRDGSRRIPLPRTREKTLCLSPWLKERIPVRGDVSCCLKKRRDLFNFVRKKTLTPVLAGKGGRGDSRPARERGTRELRLGESRRIAPSSNAKRLSRRTGFKRRNFPPCCKKDVPYPQPRTI